MKLSKKSLVMLITVLLISIIAGTFALFVWNDAPTTDVAVTVEGVKILYAKGPDIEDADIQPTFTKEEGISKEIKVSLDKVPQMPVTINFYLDIVTLPNELKHETFKWEFYKNGTKETSGNFSNATPGTPINLISTQMTTTTKDTYVLYIWIDANLSNPASMAGQSFSFTLRANGQNAIYEEELPLANEPNLIEGMIPIKYNGTTWVKADVRNTSNDWYDYNNKIWANAVMVTEATRTQHMSNPVGTPVPEADILAYLVWIPRYKYQLFNVGFLHISSNPVKEIKIEFEEGISTTGTVSCSTSNLGTETCTNAINGNWYTHPAFTFGEDELTGLWVGKFETTGSATTPTVKPNAFALRSQNISSQFATSRKFNSTSYVTNDGLTKMDAHMMKNIEWGAVAYLTQSKYGRCTSGTCTEVYINPSQRYMTGRSGNVVSQGSTTDTSGSASETLYGYDGKSCSTKTVYVCTGATHATYGLSASTTGNIHGIYDMSGGAYEYTMGAMISTSGVPYTGSDVTNNSGFTGMRWDTGEIYTGVEFPESKYYDKYAYGTSSSDHVRSHLGDATGETEGWNGGYKFFVYSSLTWFDRGGYYSNGSGADTFYFSSNGGHPYISHSWRLAIQAK